ncbi:MAG: YncE family protein [Candidatus Melainabacteria bacterium]|nr:YncE family protein [Candidatus Melainabacteria bacterium]
MKNILLVLSLIFFLQLPAYCNEILSEVKGILYLTSPDTGKIIYLNLSDLSMIYNIQTNGSPWEISYDKANKLVFVTDFSKDKIYKLKPMGNTIFKTIDLESMSSPCDIKLSKDGSLAYILESLTNNFVVYNTLKDKIFIETKLPSSPAGFSILEDKAIAITYPNSNALTFLNPNNFSITNQIMIAGGPEKIISDPINNVFYITNRIGNTISTVDFENKKVKPPIEVGISPTSIAIDSSSKWLYVTNGKSNTINIIETKTGQITDTIELPIETQFPGDIEITNDNKWLIVTSETTDTISIVDLTLKAGVRAGFTPAHSIRKVNVGATTHAVCLTED